MVGTVFLLLLLFDVLFMCDSVTHMLNIALSDLLHVSFECATLNGK